MSTGNTDEPRIVSPGEWLKARRELLKREKEFTRARDRLNAERRKLPAVRVEKDYVFDTSDGRKRLPELFDGCSQLIVHHLMFHPDWEAACPGCSFQAEHIDGPRPHLERKDVRIIAVSRAPLESIRAYRQRMGWGFKWVSSFGSDFNYDFGVSFPKEDAEAGRISYNFGTITVDARYHSEELPGISVFFRNPDGVVFHTYSTYARGLDEVIGANHYLDLTPRGRNEARHPAWPRRRDEYDN